MNQWNIFFLLICLIVKTLWYISLFKITIRLVEVRLELFSIYSIVFSFCKINTRLYVGSHDGSNVVTIFCWWAHLSAQWIWSRLLWKQLVEKFTLYQQSFWYGQNSKEYFILFLSVTNYKCVNGLLLLILISESSALHWKC